MDRLGSSSRTRRISLLVSVRCFGANGLGPPPMGWKFHDIRVVPIDRLLGHASQEVLDCSPEDIAPSASDPPRQRIQTFDVAWGQTDTHGNPVRKLN